MFTFSHPFLICFGNYCISKQFFSETKSKGNMTFYWTPVMIPHVRKGVVRLSFKQAGKCDFGCMSQLNELAGSWEKDVLLAEKQLDRKDDCYAKLNENPLEKMLCGSFFWSEFLDHWKELARSRLEVHCNYLTARSWTTTYTYLWNRMRFRNRQDKVAMCCLRLFCMAVLPQNTVSVMLTSRHSC